MTLERLSKGTMPEKGEDLGSNQLDLPPTTSPREVQCTGTLASPKFGLLFDGLTQLAQGNIEISWTHTAEASETSYALLAVSEADSHHRNARQSRPPLELTHFRLLPNLVLAAQIENERVFGYLRSPQKPISHSRRIASALQFRLVALYHSGRSTQWIQKQSGSLRRAQYGTSTSQRINLSIQSSRLWLSPVDSMRR